MNMHAMNMQLTVVVGGGFDFAYRLAVADHRLLLMTAGTRVWTLNPSNNNSSIIIFKN